MRARLRAIVSSAARWCSKSCTFERRRGFKAQPGRDIKEGLRGSLRWQPQRSGGRMFSSIEEVIERFASQKYIASRRIATVVYLASALKKPILVEGPAGVGKTDLAKVLALALGHELIRLQCYEGLDEGKALYEWEYAKQLLYTQILKDKISEVLTGAQGLAAAVDRIAKEDEVFFSERFVLPRPLLKAITSEKPVVLLIDEIDKADAEFEAFLLELLSDFQVTVPEIGTFKARQIPLVVLTSNNAREMSDALKRRCLHLYIDFPERDQELAIIKLKAPEAAEKLATEVVTVVQSLRKLDLKKSPGISETIDWVKALTLLNVQSLDQELVTETLDTIVKYEGDVRRAQEELKEYVRRARARRGGDASQAGPASDKDLLN
jgi:MoxR-like ATPase